MSESLGQERLLAILETQNEIANVGLDLDAITAVVRRRAQALTGAAAVVLEPPASPSLTPPAGATARSPASPGDPHPFAASTLSVPLEHRGRWVATLILSDPRPETFDEGDRRTVELLSGAIAAAIFNASEFERHHHQSRHDDLTGLGNRRAFDERAAAEAARVARYGGQLSLALADLDGFKAVNDADGHVAGDAVLRAVADDLRRIRGEDSAFRFGGDEFAILFAGVSAAGAGVAMRRLEKLVAADPACRGVGVSWGIASLAGQAEADLLTRADQALYRAKRSRDPHRHGRTGAATSAASR